MENFELFNGAPVENLDENHNLAFNKPGVGGSVVMTWAKFKTYLAGFFVALTGNQTIGGIKSFSSPIKVPDPVADLDAVNKRYLAEHGGGGAGSTYTGTAERTVGGFEEGLEYTDLDLQAFGDMLLQEDKVPVLTAPSSTFTSNQTGLKKIGDVFDISFAATFNRGSINPQYTADSPFRAGLPNTYTYTGTGLSSKSSVMLSDNNTLTGYVVILGAQSWTGRVAYDAGVQPKTSKGNDFSTPLPAGNTTTVTRTITGVYPIFANTVNLGTMTEQALQAHGSVITKTMLAEGGGGGKQAIEYPEIYGTLSQIAQYNTLSGQWDTVALNSFTVTNITKTINGSSVNYKRAEYNGSTIGERQVRFTF